MPLVWDSAAATRAHQAGPGPKGPKPGASGTRSQPGHLGLIWRPVCWSPCSLRPHFVAGRTHTSTSSILRGTWTLPLRWVERMLMGVLIGGVDRARSQFGAALLGAGIGADSSARPGGMDCTAQVGVSLLLPQRCGLATVAGSWAQGLWWHPHAWVLPHRNIAQQVADLVLHAPFRATGGARAACAGRSNPGAVQVRLEVAMPILVLHDTLWIVCCLARCCCCCCCRRRRCRRLCVEPFDVHMLCAAWAAYRASRSPWTGRCGGTTCRAWPSSTSWIGCVLFICVWRVYLADSGQQGQGGLYQQAGPGGCW